MKKRLVKTFNITVTVLAAAFAGISAFLGYSMTKVEREPVQGSPADFGLKYENVSFKSRDGLILKGWLLPVKESDRVIIILHGSDGNRADSSIKTLNIAAELINNGYNVLVFDLRGHGESEGNRLSAGDKERKDLLGALDFVKGQGLEKIGVLGFSMGAATAILTAADDKDIDCIVSDSCFADITEIMQREFNARTKVPGFFMRPVLFMVKLFYGVDFPAVKPAAKVSNIAPRPLLFIHGMADTFIPPEHAGRLLEASGNPLNELWMVPDAEHVRSYTTDPGKYIEKITAFFDKAWR